MSGAQPPLILASASPRRREILASLGVAVEVQPSRADEDALLIEDDVEFVRAAARMKLEDVLGACQHPGAYVLAADTIVCVDGHRLGKPADDADAVRMLELLAGRDHVVRTAMALGRVGMEIYEFLNDITLASFLRREKVNAVVRRQQASVTVDAAELKSSVV